MIKIYNTLSKKVEEVKKPNGRRLNMYSCGPTIYNYAHIGNLRSFIMADLLYRTLKIEGYSPRWVMNLTDIDDKTIKGALAKFGKDAGVKELFDFTEEYRLAFINDLKEVNVLVDEIEFIRVTEKMSDIQAFILELIEKGYAYKAEDGSAYFSIEKYQKDFGDYGRLVGEKFIEGKKVGARVAVDEYEKDNLSDFALWKAHSAESDGNIFWDHPVLGKGRPGWHIECSVINRVAFNGEPVDIHTGGVDLIFPHHTNEIAQSQALLGKGNFVRHWFHSEHLLVDGKKMSKSAGNFYTLKDLVVNTDSPLALRLAFLQTNFNVQQNFTKESFNASYRRLVQLEYLLQSSAEQSGSLADDVTQVLSALDNNLNSADALGKFSGVLDKIYEDKGKNIDTVLEIDKVFGLKLEESKNNPHEAVEGLPENVQDLIAERQGARDVKDYQKSDQLRLKIEALGYEVKDTAEGQQVTKKA